MPSTHHARVTIKLARVCIPSCYCKRYSQRRNRHRAMVSCFITLFWVCVRLDDTYRRGKKMSFCLIIVARVALERDFDGDLLVGADWPDLCRVSGGRGSHYSTASTSTHPSEMRLLACECICMNVCVSMSAKCKVLSDQFAGCCFNAIELIHDQLAVAHLGRG